MLVTHIMEATAGGSRKHLRLLAGGLRDNGVQLDLVLSRRRADPDFEDDLQVFKALGCGLYMVDVGKWPGPADFTAYQELRRLLRKRAPAIVHTHCAKAGLLGRLAASGLPGTSLIHTPHSWFFEGLGQPWRTLGAGLERWLARRGDLLLLIGEAERQWVERLDLAPPEKVLLAPNGLPANFAESLEPRDSARARLRLGPEVCAAGVFCRLVARKGHDWLLDAIAAIPEAQRQRLRFFLFGDGPLAGPLRQRVADLKLQDCVEFPGYQPGAERLLSAMDLVVLPSYYEGLPYSLLETLAAGLPLIASDVPGNRPPERGNPILYVQPGASDQLAELLVALAQAPAERQRLGAQGRDWVRQHFSLERQVATVLAAYYRLARGRST